MTTIDGEGGQGVAMTENPVLDARALIERTGTAHLIDLLRVKLGFPMEVFDCSARPVIEEHARFVQLLPVFGSTRHGVPGGRLLRSLETALRALDYRRGQILPRGAAPEVIGEHAHRWSYAVFAAALLGDCVDVVAGMRVMVNVGCEAPTPWDPSKGSMVTVGATRYRVEALRAGEASIEIDSALAAHRFEQSIPPSIRAWLAGDAGLLPELTGVLARAPDAHASAIAEIVQRAATGSTGSVIVVRVVDVRKDPCAAPEPAAVPEVTDEPVAEGGLDGLEPVRDEVPQFARRFIDWLEAGIAGGTIPVNATGALVHGVPEGMLIVSPRAFHAFIRAVGLVDGEAGSVEADGLDAARRVQQAVLRACWHVKADRGVNFIEYQLARGGRPATRITGIVIRDPKRFVDPVPSVNPMLARVTGGSPDA